MGTSFACTPRKHLICWPKHCTHTACDGVFEASSHKSTIDSPFAMYDNCMALTTPQVSLYVCGALLLGLLYIHREWLCVQRCLC
jgi:hypothetical protein